MPGSRAMYELSGPHFITVDLEVRSREDLAAFAAAVEQKGFVLHHAGRVRRKFLVIVGAKSTRRSTSPEQTIWALLKVVESLPPSARRLWRQADSRTFSVGYDGGDFVTLLYERPVGSGRWYPRGRRKAEPCETSFTPELLRAVANVKGTIGTTIYPPMRRAPSRGPKRGSSAAAKGPAQPAVAADGRVSRVAPSRARR
jgi:hypothetical protein